MTRKTIIPTVIIICAAVTFAQLPVVKITTGTPAPSSAASTYNINSCPNASAAGSAFLAPTQDYRVMTEFTITGASNPSMNITLDAKGADSIRIRGNSTSFMVPTGNDAAKSFRVKFGGRRGLFGMKESKSWALLANFFDPTQMLSVIGFELGKRMGLDNSLPYEFVKLNYNGKDIGVYVLTPQISGTSRPTNSGVYVDVEYGGWLAEFTHWGPGDAEDCKRFFLATRLNGNGSPSYKYVLNTKIRTPELEDLPLINGQPNTAEYDYVKNDINAFVNKLNDNGFPNNGYRDLIDLRGWAVYSLINLFMDNRDWNTAGDAGGLGSNFIYKVNSSGKIKAGPLWDIDLGAGSPGVMGGQFFSTSTTTRNTKPSHALYERLWSDNAGFLPCYVESWNTHKAMIKAIGEDGGLIDSLTDKLAPSINGKFAMRESSQSFGASGTTYTEASYRTFVGRMKSWWNTRYTNFDNAVKALNVTGTCPSDTPPPPVCEEGYELGEDGECVLIPPASADSRVKSVSAARVSAAKNGIRLNVANKAVIKVYSLDGRELRKVSLAKGNHTLGFGALPRGMYIVRVSIDGIVRTLRVPVR